MLSTLIDDYYDLIEQNGYHRSDFSIEEGLAGPPYLGEIKVVRKKNGKSNLYKIQNFTPGWLEFEDNLKSGFFN